MRVPLALCVVAIAGCHSFDLPPPPAPALKAVGAECADAAECDSQSCVDAVCCETACAAQQTCARKGSLGKCTDRLLGESCQNDPQCPSGFCSDGVCCSSRCTDLRCHTCANPTGTCALAETNSDARGECDRCLACYSGVCAPARPGTDSNHKCGTGLVCDANRACGWPAGASCDLGSASGHCAVGECLGGRCMKEYEIDLQQAPMNPNAQIRQIMSVAGGPNGEIAVLFSETDRRKDTQGDYFLVEDSLMLAMRAGSGSFVVLMAFQDFIRDLSDNLQNPQAGYIPSSVEFFADMAYVATYSYSLGPPDPVCGALPYPPCGLFGQYFALDGAAIGFEPMDSQVRNVAWVSLVKGQDGSLSAVYAGTPPSQTSTRLLVTTRDLQGHWSSPLLVDPAPDALREATTDPMLAPWSPAWTPAVARTAAGPVVFFRDASKQLWVWSGGKSELVTNLPPPPGSTRACGVGGPMRAATFGDGGAEAVRFNGYCHDMDAGDEPVTIVGTWRPSSPAGMRFTVEAGPGHVWGTGPNDDPQFLVPLSIPGRPLLYAQVPPCDPIGTPPTNAEAHLTWFDTSFHQTTTYFPPSDSYILTFDAVVLARQTPLVALTLSPLADYVSANGPAVVLLEYR